MPCIFFNIYYWFNNFYSITGELISTISFNNVREEIKTILFYHKIPDSFLIGIKCHTFLNIYIQVFY
jgi:hypothetical protein